MQLIRKYIVMILDNDNFLFKLNCQIKIIIIILSQQILSVVGHKNRKDKALPFFSFFFF